MSDLNKRGEKDEIKGKIKEMEGKGRAETGKATGNLKEEVKGRVGEGAGKVERQFGKGERKV